jgi:UDP-glucose 4-epimerase
MARYFFHTADGSCDRDEEGVELPDVQAARIEAIRYIGEMLTQHPDVLGDGHDFSVEVVNEDDTLLFKVITRGIDATAG